jgi:hypothetical protein
MLSRHAVGLLLVALCGRWLPLAGAHGATFTVTADFDGFDSSPGDGVCATASGACTLRAATQESNALTGLDEILLPAGLFTLTLADPASPGGLLVTHVIVRGAGRDQTIIDGGMLGDWVLGHSGGSGYFEVHGVTIRNGRRGVTVGPTIGRLVDCAVVENAEEGVRYGGTIYVVNSIVTRNGGDGVLSFGGLGVLFADDSAFGQNAGVGIRSETAIISNSLIAGNQLGGVLAVSRGTTIIGSTIRDNQGPGVRTVPDSSVFLIDSLVQGNVGGVHARTDFAFVAINSTISMNAGTGVVVAGPAGRRFQLRNVTISGNTGGIEVVAGDAVVVNSIVAGNVNDSGVPSDCSGPIAELGYSLLGDPTGCALPGQATGSLIGLDALLGPLGDGGGRTFTQVPDFRSPAVDAGDPAGCTDHNGVPLATDQRGLPRHQGARCDMGAVEHDVGVGLCVESLRECEGGRGLDADGDGEVDATDRCPETPADEAVDEAGCSLGQFCGLFAVTSRADARACKRADWRNDEPLMRLRERDCTIVRERPGRDDRCAPLLATSGASR